MTTASKIRTAIALLIAITGMALISLVPYSRWTYTRARRDLDRARAPLVSVPVKNFQQDRDYTLIVIPPNDGQWQRLRTRLGRPALVVMLANDMAAAHREAYSVTDAQLQVRGTQRGRPMEISVTKELPFDYSSTVAQDAYKFFAPSDDAVELTVRMTPTGVSDGALLVVVPLWNPLEFWDLGDSLSMGQGLTEAAAPVLMILGVVMIFLSVMVGLIPMKPTR